MFPACFHICSILLLCLCSSGQLGVKLAANSSASSQSCIGLLLQLHLCQHAALCLHTTVLSLRGDWTRPLYTSNIQKAHATRKFILR